MQGFLVHPVHLVGQILTEEPLGQSSHPDGVKPHGTKPRRQDGFGCFEPHIRFSEHNALVTLPSQEPVLVQLGEWCVTTRRPLSLKNLLGDGFGFHENKLRRYAGCHRAPDIHKPIPQVLPYEWTLEGRSLGDPSSHQPLVGDPTSRHGRLAASKGAKSRCRPQRLVPLEHDGDARPQPNLFLLRGGIGVLPAGQQEVLCLFIWVPPSAQQGGKYNRTSLHIGSTTMWPQTHTQVSPTGAPLHILTHMCGCGHTFANVSYMY